MENLIILALALVFLSYVIGWIFTFATIVTNDIANGEVSFSTFVVAIVGGFIWPIRGAIKKVMKKKLS